MSTRRLGLLGGTFDPIHHGHLDAAEAAATALDLDAVDFVPAHRPPHKLDDLLASTFHRFALVALALQDRQRFRVSDRELTRPGPSYTVDTFRALHRDGWHASQIFFILGADAFAHIASWRAYPALLDAAHFVVVARPGTSLEAAVGRAPEVRSRTRRLAGGAVDTTQPAVFLLEARTRDVSSTQIRTRLAAQQDIDDLVPAPVARYIHAHHLYGAVDELHGQDERIGSRSL